jgi:hypothetical protein
MHVSFPADAVLPDALLIGDRTEVRLSLRRINVEGCKPASPM